VAQEQVIYSAESRNMRIMQPQDPFPIK